MTRSTQAAPTNNWTAHLPLPDWSSCILTAVSRSNNDKRELSNNATSFHTPHQGKGKGKYSKGKGRQMGKGRGRGRKREQNRDPSRSPSTRPKGKGKGRGQKGNSQTTTRPSGDRKPQDPCSYCGAWRQPHSKDLL